jgi:ketosteroid isomerase-like protein
MEGAAMQQEVCEATERTRAVIRSVYEAYAAGDLDRLAPALSEEVDWAILAPEYLFGFAGERRGREAVMATLREIRRLHDILSYEPQVVLADGSEACVYSICRVRDRESGREAVVEICDLMRLERGRIIWFREFIDPVKAAVALFGGSPRPI